MNHRLKIVMVNPHLGPVLGGLQKDMLCLAREFIAMGDRVTFVTTYDEFPEGRVDLDRPLTYEMPPDVEIVRLEGHFRTHLRHFQPANPPLWLPGLARAVLRFEPDVVIFFNIGWPLTILPTLLRLRRKTVVLFRTAYHGYEDHNRLDPFRRRLKLGVAGLSHCLLTYSQFEKLQIIGHGHVPAEKIMPVYPGVDIWDPDPDDVHEFQVRHDLLNKIIVSHVARLSAFKGTDKLIRALPRLRQQSERDVVLLLVGRNVEEEYLADLVRDLGVEAHCRFTGPLSEQDLHLAYAASDLFALPSEYESLGFVFLEAMAHGLPVVGVRTGGVPEVIRNGRTGFLLDSNGNLEELACLLGQVLNNQMLRQRLGEQARQWVSAQFSWHRATEQVKGIIHQIAIDRI